MIDFDSVPHLNIYGGTSLRGVIEISGSKNSALPVIASCILLQDGAVLTRVPNIIDVLSMQRLLGTVGVASTYDPATETMRTKPFSCNKNLDPAPEYMTALRASICIVGPLLARRGRVRISIPGGCAIGLRPIRAHIHGMERLGARVRYMGDSIEFTSTRLRGAVISLAGGSGTSVTATANTILAASLASGKTVLKGGSREPEIIDLAKFLNFVGARVSGAGTSCISIHGVDELAFSRDRAASKYALIPDRIEAGTFAIAAAATLGEVTLTNVQTTHLCSLISELRRCGATVESIGGDGLVIAAEKRLVATKISAGPYPELATDLQPQFTSLLAISNGNGRVRDIVFPRRFAHVPSLRMMGARIRKLKNNQGILVSGVEALSGCAIEASDLRCGAALLIAALCAEGQSKLFGVLHLDRGYSKIEKRLTSLGASVSRTTP